MKLVCVVGPTGCGKTWLGVELAKMLGGEVVSCDSMQIYRGMAIGTAAPTAEEMQGIPHHMVGVADPREKLLRCPLCGRRGEVRRRYPLAREAARHRRRHGALPQCPARRSRLRRR